MCGIAGEVSLMGCRLSPEQKREILRSLTPRGPDQEGVWEDRCACLMHRRLAVVDVEGGRQPMTVQRDGETYVLVYNGELYNTSELRNRLQKEGEVFETRSDTEVVLRAFLRWGEDCPAQMNGIFAFAVWCSRCRRLFLARDPMGVKPLFYGVKGERLVFSSEIKGILHHPDFPPKVGKRGLQEVFLLGPGRTPGCGIYADIYEVKPGWCGFYEEGQLRLHPYWELEDRPCEESEEEIISHVRRLVLDVIRRQLVSDMPVGTFLSGGLDSSLISSVAASTFRQEGKVLKTFSVDYVDQDKYFQKSFFQPASDNAYIQEMTEYLRTDHRRVVLTTQDLVEGLFEAVQARDLPGMADVDSSLLMFCKKIKEDVTVALSGECADEIFGGYPWYRDPRVRSVDGFPWAQNTRYRIGFLRPEWQGKLDGETFVEQRYRETLRDVQKREDLPPLESRMKEMMVLNLRWFMQTLLDRKDRMSMYSGLEVRVPFCDKRITEYLYTVPWQVKEYDGREKGLLRKAAEGLLPDHVLWRKKSPYPKTHDPAYRTAVSVLLEDLLRDRNAPLWDVADPEAVRALLTDDRTVPWYGQLMTVPQTMAYFVSVNAWMEKYHVQIS